jgi:hypothetical protein
MGSSNTTAVSETTAKNLTENISNNLTSIAKSTGAYIMGNQSISISGVKFNCAGGVQMGGISQKIVATINFNQLSQSINENSLRQILSSAVNKTLETDQKLKTSLGGSSSNSTDRTRTLNENINKIVNNYSYSEFTTDIQSASASQSINFKDMEIISTNPNVPCTIENISQDIALDILSKNIAEKIIKNSVDGSTKLDLDVSKKTTQNVTAEGAGEAVGSIFSSIGELILQPFILFGLFLLIIIIAVLVMVYKIF